MAVRWGVLTLAILVIAIQLCSTDAAGAKPKPGAGKPVQRKPVGKPPAGGKPGKATRSYQKTHNDECKHSKNCNLYKALDCIKGTCQCMFTIHEWDPTHGCHDPDDVPPAVGEPVEPEPEPETNDPEDPAIDEIAPPPEDGEETPEEAKKRKQWFKAVRLGSRPGHHRNLNKPQAQGAQGEKPPQKPKPKPKGK